MIDASDELVRADNRIVEILIWTKHLVAVEVGRIQQVEIDPLDQAGPTRIDDRPAFFMMRKQALPHRVSVIVERDRTISDENMISRKAFRRNDPLGMKTIEWRATEIRPGKDGAGAMAEKDAVGKSPPPHGILLDAMLENVHAGYAEAIPGTVSNKL